MIEHNKGIPEEIDPQDLLLKSLAAYGSGHGPYCGTVVLDFEKYRIRASWNKETGKPHISIITKYPEYSDGITSDLFTIIDSDGKIHTEWKDVIEDCPAPKPIVRTDKISGKRNNEKNSTIEEHIQQGSVPRRGRPRKVKA